MAFNKENFSFIKLSGLFYYATEQNRLEKLLDGNVLGSGILRFRHTHEFSFEFRILNFLKAAKNDVIQEFISISLRSRSRSFLTGFNRNNYGNFFI